MANVQRLKKNNDLLNKTLCSALIFSPVVGRKIQQRFIDESESDTWWESRIVISVEGNLENPDFTVNFFEGNLVEGDDNEDEVDLFNVYEVCTLKLIDDYLNNDVRFLSFFLQFKIFLLISSILHISL